MTGNETTRNTLHTLAGGFSGFLVAGAIALSAITPGLSQQPERGVLIPEPVTAPKNQAPEYTLSNQAHFYFSAPFGWNLQSSETKTLLKKDSSDFPAITILYRNERELKMVMGSSYSEKNGDARGFYRELARAFQRHQQLSRPGFTVGYQGIEWLSGDLCLVSIGSFNPGGAKAARLNSILLARRVKDGLITLEAVLGKLDDTDILKDFAQIRDSLIVKDPSFLPEKPLKDHVRGIAAMTAGDFAAAEKCFAAAAEAAPAGPGKAEILYRQALAVQAAKNFSDIGRSSALFGKACKEYGEHFPSMNQLAVCWAAVSDSATQEGRDAIDFALKVFDDSLSVNPGGEEALRLKADYLIKLGRSNLVSPLLSKIMGIPALSPEALAFRKAIVRTLKGE